MRILGLDFGSKTVGVAVSDALLITAQGVEIIRRKAPTKLRQTLARIEQLVSEYEVEKIQFTDPDTNEVVEFAVEEQTQLNGIRYLLVSDGNENGDSEAYILKEIKTQDEEVFYEMVDDDTEFAALAKIFAELADEETQLLY